MDTGSTVMMMTARFSRRNAASSVGRPTLFGRPLTNAEKQARWRAAHPCVCGRTAFSHKSSLDLLVRTDTKGVGRGPRGSAGPLIPACRMCGWPMRACVCQD